MKLKCNHKRRVMVLPSGNTVHRSDGTDCRGTMSIGGSNVTKMNSPENGKFVILGPSPRTPAHKLLEEIFTDEFIDMTRKPVDA
jgi:hypothetical protein